MEYVLMCTKSQQVHYVCLTLTRAVKKVTNLSQASRFMSQTEAKRLRDHASKKLRKYKIRSIAEATTESRTIQEKQQIKRKAIPASVRAKIYNQSEGHCAICGKFVTCDAYTIDHIIPLSKGGTDEESNLQCTCLVCNRMKQDILPDDLVKKMSKIMVYQLKKKENKKYKKKLKKKLAKI